MSAVIEPSCWMRTGMGAGSTQTRPSNNNNNWQHFHHSPIIGQQQQHMGVTVSQALLLTRMCWKVKKKKKESFVDVVR